MVEFPASCCDILVIILLHVNRSDTIKAAVGLVNTGSSVLEFLGCGHHLWHDTLMVMMITSLCLCGFV